MSAADQMVEERCEYYHKIHARISCLGFMEDGEYKKEPDVEDNIKDLLRYLRKEKSDTCAIRREMGRAKIVVSDLIPLLKTYPSDQSLFEIVIRLLMNLTQPALICFRNEMPTDKVRLGFYIELESILRDYKLAFADSELMEVLGSKVSTLLEREWADRSEDDRLLIERILIVVRNILHISQDVNNEKLLDAEVSLHDQVLWAMKTGHWDTLLLFLSNSDTEQSAFAFHTLEIMSLLFREQDPATLARAGEEEVNRKDDSEKVNLERALLRESEQRRQQMLSISQRHNRFGGCYELRGVTAVGEHRSVLYHHNPRDPDRSFDRDKHRTRIPSNRAPRRERELTRKSSLSVRLFLRRLGNRLLAHCYNPLMRIAMGSLQREAAQENDETYYMWAMRFFMAFSRHSRSTSPHYISETLNVPTFHWLFNQITNYLDHLQTDRKKGVQWSRRLQLAIAAYKEMLECLHHTERTTDPELKRSAHIIKSNVFYMPEYREIFPHLLKRFDQRFQNRTYLSDLVEGTHLLIKMLEYHLSSAGGSLIVKEKTNRSGRKSKPGVKKRVKETWDADRLEAVWTAQSDALAAAIRGEGEPPNPDELPRLFDATADSTDRAQDIKKALIVIQDELRAERPNHALALLRLAKELWPEEEALSIDDELLALRDIHMTSIEREPDADDGNQADEEQEMEDREAERQAERERRAFAKEAKFDLDAYLTMFAHAKVVEAYAVLLSEYERNTDHVNYCIIRMFHRLAVRLKTPAILYQLRIFRVFQRFLLEDPLSNTDHYKEMRRFAIFILRQFFTNLKSNPKLAIEILFWKSMKEGKQIAAGDYLFEERAYKSQWTEEEIAQVRQLYEELKDEEPQQPGTDTVDLIMARLGDTTKTRRQIVGRLLHDRIINSVKDLKRKERPKGERRPREEEPEREWYDEEIEELKEKVARIGTDQARPVQLLRAMMSFPVSIKQLKLILLKTGLAPPSWRIRPFHSKSKKRSAWSDDEGLDERLLRDTSSSSSEDELMVGGTDLAPVLGELVSTEEETLKWLHTELSTMLEDNRDDIGESGVVLVPIDVSHGEAIETEPVRRILRALGLSPPDDSSRYWRLGAWLVRPGDGREKLLSRLGWLKRAAEGEDLTEQALLNMSRASKSGKKSSSSSSDSSDLSSIDEEFLRTHRVQISDQDSDAGSAEKNTKKSRGKTKRPRRREKDSSETDDSEEDKEGKIRGRRKKETSNRKKKSRQRNKEDSDDDGVEEWSEESRGRKKSKQKRGKRKEAESEEEEEEEEWRGSSDSEEEEVRQRSRKEKKTKRAIESSEDEAEKEDDANAGKETSRDKHESGKSSEKDAEEEAIKQKPRRRKMVRISEIVFSSDEEEDPVIEEDDELSRALGLSGISDRQVADSDKENEKTKDDGNDAEDEDEDEDEDVFNLSSRKISSKRRRLAFDSDYEEDEEDINQCVETGEKRESKVLKSDEEESDKSPQPKKRRLLMSDSDED